MIDWSKGRADLTATYREVFQKDLPELDTDFTDEEMCYFLIECLRWRRTPNARTMNDHDLLDLQYRIKFPESDGIPQMMIHMPESEWQATMRECLKSGKPYKLPSDVQRLIDEGVIF